MKIVAFPKDTVPYQELLYQPLREMGHTVDYLDGPTGSHTLNVLAFPWMAFYYRSHGYRTFHLHWVYLFKLPWLGSAGRALMQVYFMGCIWWLKILGFKLVWTVHNVMPHSPQFLQDVQARRFLAARADRLIVHSSATLAELKARGISTARAVVVPQGSYVDVYEHTISQATARKELGIPLSARVVLFFGRIEPYKNLPALQRSFEDLHKTHPELYLIIAGKCDSLKTVRQLGAFQAAFGKNVVLRIQFIADEQLQIYFAAADVAAFPFKEVTTSATVMTALSFGTPVVAPRLGALVDIPEEVGFWYNAQEPAGLTNALRRSVTSPSLAKWQERALEYATEFSWDAIAIQTLAALPHADELTVVPGDQNMPSI